MRPGLSRPTVPKSVLFDTRGEVAPSGINRSFPEMIIFGAGKMSSAAMSNWKSLSTEDVVTSRMVALLCPPMSGGRNRTVIEASPFPGMLGSGGSMMVKVPGGVPVRWKKRICRGT